MSTLVAPPAVVGPPLHRLLGQSAQVLRAVREGRTWSQAVAHCPTALRPGVQALGFLALRRLGRAMALRERLATRPPPPQVDNLLLLTLALMCDAQDGPYPDHTLVDQAVEATKHTAPRAAGMVNAVLRRFLRERDDLLAATDADPVALWNHPAWWIERMRSDWPEHWREVLRANQMHAPMTLRVHAARGGPQDYVERLRVLGMAARAVGPQAVRLEQPCAVQRLPGFDDGDVSVQDLAAQWAAPLLLDACASRAAHNEHPLRVLDACAAPGGKTAHLLELAAARGWPMALLALDVDGARVTRVHETLARVGLAAQVRCADAGQPDAWWDGQPFDAILLDAPCTASGIVRRHPDVRWLRRAQDVPALCAVQARLLDTLWPLLAPGGVLLYATCSVFKAEGIEQALAFGQRHADALACPAPGHVLPLPAPGVADGLPADHDGFFHALFRKGDPPVGAAP